MTISDEQAWLIIYAGILSIRFHPKAHPIIRGITDLETIYHPHEDEIKRAACLADEALRQFKERYPWQSSEA